MSGLSGKTKTQADRLQHTAREAKQHPSPSAPLLPCFMKSPVLLSLHIFFILLYGLQFILTQRLPAHYLILCCFLRLLDGKHLKVDIFTAEVTNLFCACKFYLFLGEAHKHLLLHRHESIFYLNLLQTQLTHPAFCCDDI